jgi:hypothetical protein
MPEEKGMLMELLLRVIESNEAYARPGAGRRKQGFRQGPANKSRHSPSNKT